MARHDWVPSTLGHGETMCRYCYGTNRELAVLGQLDHCDKAPESGLAGLIADLEGLSRAEHSDLSVGKEAAETIRRLTRCLTFFQSVIKSGEPWTETCEQEYRRATTR